MACLPEVGEGGYHYKGQYTHQGRHQGYLYQGYAFDAVSHGHYCVGMGALRIALGCVNLRRAYNQRCMEQRKTVAKLLPTPFVSSFIGSAREGSLHDPNPDGRAAAWATWVLGALEEFKGLSDREYFGIVLPGRFHDVSKNSVPVRPHLEIPEKVLSSKDPNFPARLAQAGNALEFPWWLLSEVTAVRRAVFSGPRGDIGPLLKVLNAHQQTMIGTLSELNSSIGKLWHLVEEKLVTTPKDLLRYASAPFTKEEVAAFMPAAREINLSVVYEETLAKTNAEWAVRRIGVWQMRADTPKGSMSLGVVTPRLTRNSLFADPLFAPAAEAPAALLVRCLLLRRLLTGFLKEVQHDVLSPDPVEPGEGGPYLRAVIAKPGAKLPEASVESAVRFLQAYPDGEKAWKALNAWAGVEHLLTVSYDAFITAHTNSLRYIRRAETPMRNDINVVLPLAWDSKSRVVRLTFVRPSVRD